MFQIDVESELQKVISQFNSLPDMMESPDVLAKAINATASEVRRKLGIKVQKKYAVTDKQILKERSRGGMSLQKASGNIPEATLISKGGMLDVMAYMTHRNSGTTAAMLKVLNDRQMTALEVDGRKAFETTFKSGHTAIVQRRGHERLPVKKLLAPAVPFLYGKAYEESELDFYSILQKHIQRQVARALGR